jgi:xanthine dehydrogenase accessory factor
MVSATPPEDLLEQAAALRRRGEPFVLATVVRCQAPTSAKPGAKALIRVDGTLVGWVGGACAEPVVVREALDALRDGRPRLVGLVGEAGPRSTRNEGLVEYPMTCHSGGTLEIYVEPYLPQSVLLVVGHGPVVETLATLGRTAGYTVEIVPDAALSQNLARSDLGPRSSVIVATHADTDEDALDQVLRSAAGYVSLVASRRRATALVESLRRRGVPAERLGALRAPAGLDIGARTPQEIAVSILAEVIQHHRAQKPAPVDAEPRSAPAGARDPVCGMPVETGSARPHSELSGRAVYFCCRGCKDAFDQDPERYRAALVP